VDICLDQRAVFSDDDAFAYACFADVDSNLQKLAANTRSTPHRVFTNHHPDQFGNLMGNARASRLAAPNFPGSEQTEACACQAITVAGLTMKNIRSPFPGTRPPDQRSRSAVVVAAVAAAGVLRPSGWQIAAISRKLNLLAGSQLLQHTGLCRQVMNPNRT
jgi:hypothetical protein